MPQQGPERFPVITPVLLIPVCPGSIGADPSAAMTARRGRLIAVLVLPVTGFKAGRAVRFIIVASISLKLNPG